MVDFTCVNGVNLITDGDMVVRAQEQRGRFEPEAFEAWKECAKPGATVIDVGCYTGVYAIAAAKLGATVIAIDPNIHAIRRAKENADLNGVSINLIHSAALHKNGFVSLDRRQALSSATKIRSNSGPTPAVTLDSLEPVSPVRAIKIDAEGSEAFVLQGAKGIISLDRPAILMEVLTPEALASQRVELYGYNYSYLGQSMYHWTS